jgi:hypothetical protein
MTLRERLDGVAADLGEVETRGAAGGTTYLRAGREFAFVDSGGAEFRLDPEIAEAALRTPGTSPSPERPGWVRLTGDASDRTVGDRAEAWFKIGWRTAGR